VPLRKKNSVIKFFHQFFVYVISDKVFSRGKAQGQAPLSSFLSANKVNLWRERKKSGSFGMAGK
jgi:hypothetical protein